MPMCKICRKPVTSGVVVHSKCYEELNNFDNTQSKLLLIKISELRTEIAELKGNQPIKCGECKYFATEKSTGLH